jgi:hypothetical protein
MRVKFGRALRWFARATRDYGRLRSCAVTKVGWRVRRGTTSVLWCGMRAREVWVCVKVVLRVNVRLRMITKLYCYK